MDSTSRRENKKIIQMLMFKQKFRKKAAVNTLKSDNCRPEKYIFPKICVKRKFL